MAISVGTLFGGIFFLFLVFCLIRLLCYVMLCNVILIRLPCCIMLCNVILIRLPYYIMLCNKIL